MPMPVNWYDDEHSIIVVTITRESTWDDYYHAINWIVAEANKVDYRVDIIFHDNVGMPKGNPMPHLGWGSTKIIHQANIHLSIIAGSRGYSGFVRTILGALAKSYMNMKKMPDSGGGLLFMRNLDEALAYIKKDRIQPSAA